MDITAIILTLLNKYGLAGALVAICIYYFRDLGNKIDRLSNLNNKTFGVMLALVDSKKRKSLTKEADDVD